MIELWNLISVSEQRLISELQRKFIWKCWSNDQQATDVSDLTGKPSYINSMSRLSSGHTLIFQLLSYLSFAYWKPGMLGLNPAMGIQ